MAKIYLYINLQKKKNILTFPDNIISSLLFLKKFCFSDKRQKLYEKMFPGVIDGLSNREGEEKLSKHNMTYVYLWKY